MKNTISLTLLLIISACLKLNAQVQNPEIFDQSAVFTASYSTGSGESDADNIKIQKPNDEHAYVTVAFRLSAPETFDFIKISAGSEDDKSVYASSQIKISKQNEGWYYTDGSKKSEIKFNLVSCILPVLKKDFTGHDRVTVEIHHAGNNDISKIYIPVY
jgi:hypothetical protein